MGDVAGIQMVHVTVNGEEHDRAVPVRRLLVHLIRDDLGLRGTHIGCDTGNCGACTVVLDGKLVKSCMVLGVQADGAEIETVEGLAPRDGELSALQRTFSEHHALQCGYCTPGFLLNARHLLKTSPNPTREEIRRHLKGNLCRCTGYVNIVRAIEAAAEAGAEAAAELPPATVEAGAGGVAR